MTETPRPILPDAVAAMLRGAATTFAAEARALPEPLRRWHPSEGEWCVKEVLGHVIEAERRGFAGRIRIILAAAAPPLLERWDQGAVAREREDPDFRATGEPPGPTIPGASDDFLDSRRRAAITGPVEAADAASAKHWAHARVRVGQSCQAETLRLAPQTW